MAVGTTTGELRELTEIDLTDKLRESKEELFNLRFQLATGQLDNSARMRLVKKDIARVNTELRAREIADADALASSASGEES